MSIPQKKLVKLLETYFPDTILMDEGIADGNEYYPPVFTCIHIMGRVY